MIEKFFDDILEGNLEDDFVRERLEDMYRRGESVEEISLAAKSMIKHMIGINPCVEGELLDIVGTGGDGSGSINISTISAFVAAGAGCYVAKHCNRGVSSKFGSVDLLEELGVNFNLSPEETSKLIEEIGIGFMYAPLYHPAMKNVANVRKQIGHRTIFNILGPLTNPANAQTRLIGAYDLLVAEKIACSVRELGIHRVLVVHSPVDGLDEISARYPTDIFESNKLEDVKRYCFSPGEYKMRGDLRVNSSKESAKICKKILCNENLTEREKAMRSAVILNAGVGIYTNLENISRESCFKMAEDSIDNGAAAEKLEQLIRMSG